MKPATKLWAGLALAIGLAGSAFAQLPPFMKGATQGPPPDADPHVLRGVYSGGVPGRLTPLKDTSFYNAAGLKLVTARVALENAGQDRKDPQTYCRTGGPVRYGSGSFPVRFITTPGQITIIASEDHVVRRIYLDQQHPAHLTPSIIGDSVGHWEGNVLVVDTIGFKDNGWMDEDGSPSSSKLHLSERITKADGGKEIDDAITINDPTYYNKPFTYLHKYIYVPGATWDEMICEENNRDAGPSSN